jgi:peptidoglycan DL-endopeptidase CwlO
MKKIKVAQIRSYFGVITVCFVLILATFINVVRADQYDAQIQALQTYNNNNQAVANQLGVQASSYQDAINKLQAQISGLQAAIAANQQQNDKVQQQIDKAQADLTQQKQVLGEDIKAMYLEGQTSTLEVLASSKDLSDFVDKQQARNAVSDKVKDTVAKISDLEAQLKSQQAQLQQLIKEQQSQNDQLTADQNKQAQLLAYTEGQKAAYDQQISVNNSQIGALRAQQAAANRQLDGSGQVITSGSCGGGYPASASGPLGSWGCNYSLDNTIDNFGMYNRECVSYTAWMVYKNYGYMPNWGGSGNANQWPGDARAAGIPTGYTPKVGSVAIYMGNASTDPFGHAMWVVGVSGNSIHVYSYNDYYDGNFYDHWVNGAGLTYIYFGG